MSGNKINYVNFNNSKGTVEKPGNKTRDRMIMAVGGLFIFILTFFIYGIMDDTENSGQKEIVTDNLDILAQIDQLDEQKMAREEKLGKIKNDVFLGENTDVDEYTKSLINDLKNLAEESDNESDKSEDKDIESYPSSSQTDEEMDIILSYLREGKKDSHDVFAAGRNKTYPVPKKYRESKTIKKVRSLFAFSNTRRSARIYNNGFTNISSETFDQPDTNMGAGKSSKSSDKMCLIFNSNPVFTISEGEFLYASLSNRIVNDKRKSPVTAVITRDFLDDSGRFVLIPANSRVTGFAQKVSGQQDTRLFINFHRIILPNGRSLDLGFSKNSMTAMDHSGALGVRGRKNSHFFTKFGSSILYGSLNGLSGFAQNRLDQSSGLSHFIDRTSDNFNTLNDRLASDSMAIVPTIMIKEGTEVKVRFASDVKISAYTRVSDRTYY